MQNVLLRDTDQMSMAHALEVRVPFLDHELVELVLGIDDSAKYPHTPKQLLVETLGDLLPPEIVNRPKMGFALPFADWMRGDLRAFCDTRLRRLAERPQFDGSTVLTYWRAFLDGKRSVGWSRIWVLVTLEHWLDRNGVH
jgi:asparagine synthase (glutamine-hydrolysing)